MDVIEFEILDTVVEPTELLNPVTDILESVTYNSCGVPIVTYENLIRDITSVNGNTRLGAGSMTVNISGYAPNNFAFGFEALSNTMSGVNANTMIGYQAGYSNTLGEYNVGVGSRALYSNLSGNNNVAVGVNALLNTFSSDNIGVGSNVLYSNICGERNIGIGAYALYSNTGGSDNLGVGNNALYNNTIGYNNVAVGYNALYSNTFGYNNLSIGTESMYSNTVGYKNTAIGSRSLYSDIFGTDNVSIGFETMYNGTFNTFSVGLGYKSLYNTTGNTKNIGIGYTALASQDYRSNNIGIGYQAMELSTGYGPSIGIGTRALRNMSITDEFQYAIGIGMESLLNLTEGISNLSIGHESLKNITTQNQNHAVGNRSLINLIDGDSNTAFGVDCMSSLATGWANTCFGNKSNLIGTDCSNVICIGYDAQPSSTSTTDEITLGDSNVAVLRCQVPLTVTSDERDKTDIKDLKFGLEFIEKLRPVKFRWDKREWYGYDSQLGVANGSRKQETFNTGLIAQEVDQIQTENNWEFLKTVFNKNPERLEITYANIIYPMIKAIQQLSATVKALKAELVDLEAAAAV